ncbi:MAG: alanine racemase [Myxococcota bacterium]
MREETAAARLARYQKALAADALPAAFVDLDGFDANVDFVFDRVARSPKRLRVATKSIRCLRLIERVIARDPARVIGLMAWSAREAVFLADRGFRDIVVAYPTMASADLTGLARVNASGSFAAIVVDAIEHVEAAERAARSVGAPLPLLIELDLALRPFGGDLAIGALRSSVHQPRAVVELAERIASSQALRFAGVMGYEAHVAGMVDQARTSAWMNTPKWMLKRLSRGPIAEFRRQTVEALSQRGLSPQVVNGGGTGSLDWSLSEAALTEVTVGSGFLAGHLFDGYRGLSLSPALHFAAEVARRPRPGVATVNGGGFIASGEIGPDRAPLPVLPEGLSLTKLEGAGEVQTPLLHDPSINIALGSAVIFRPAKSGELAERFNEYALIRGDRVEERAPTYRGEGACF